MKIVSSTVSVDPTVLPNGRFSVTERHLFEDGRDVVVSYLADPDIDTALVANTRAARLEAEDFARERALEEAKNGELPLTEMAFRRRFTIAERRAVDRFNARFETNPDLTEDQKDVIRTGLLDLRASNGISLKDPLTIAGVTLYETLGLIGAGRAVEILSV